MLEALREIDEVVLNFNEGGKLFLNITIAFIMFGVALDIRMEDFKRLLKEPKPILVGIFSQFLLLPLLTFLLCISLTDYITPTVGLGMILVACCPGGNISNLISSLSKGNVALSVSLTAFSSIASILLTPFNFAFWGNLFTDFYASAQGGLVQPLVIDVWNVLLTVMLILGLPLALGLFFMYRYPQWTNKVKVTIKRLSIFFFAAIVIAIFAANFDYFIKYIGYIFLIVLFHNALALFSGYQIANIFRLDKRNRKTISIETGIQNSGLALAFLFNPLIFPPEMAIGGMTFIAAWWGLWHIVSGLTVAGFWSGFSLRDEPAEGVAGEDPLVPGKH